MMLIRIPRAIQADEMKFNEKLGMLVTNKSALARKVGVAQSAIHEMISGKRRPYLDQAWAIAKELGVSLDYLADDTLSKPLAPEITEDEREILKLVRLLGVKEALVRLIRAPASFDVLPPMSSGDIPDDKGGGTT